MEFKVELDKELKKEKEKTKEEFGNFSENTQLLLDAGADEDKEALRAAGLNHEILEAEHSRGIEIDRKNLEEEYGLDVYTKDEIKNLCIKYDLRFLRSSHYAGKLDSIIAGKLKKFIKDNPVGDVSDSFYIIAPAEAFDLRGRDATTKNAADPILVYKVPKEDKYLFIHKWGRDFTILRRLRGLYMESESNMLSVGTSILTVFISIIFAFSFSKFTGEWYQYLNMLWIVGLSFIVNLGFLAIMFRDDDDYHERASGYIWDTREKRRKK